MMDYVVEPEKRVPVVYDVDVAVSGAGVSGVFAAVAAARHGADTVLVDRFGSVGGNIGPGFINNGHLASGRPHPKAPWNAQTFPGPAGLALEFIQRHAALGGETLPPYSQPHYLKDSNIASYVMLKMLQEAGVKLILSAYSADPIMEGTVVRGLFVETKSGRQAIKASVVIDATGEADVARRAGAPALYPKTEYHAVDGHAPTGMGLAFVVARVDWARYEAFLSGPPASDEDVKRVQESFPRAEKGGKESRSPMLSCVGRALENGDYPRAVMEGVGELKAGVSGMVGYGPEGLSERLAWGRASPPRVGELNIADGRQISELEAKLRGLIFETVQYYRKYVPGFERAYLLLIAPFLGARGGPCIEGEYTLTMDDCRAGRRFDDVIHLYGEFRALRYTCEQGECKWVDMPYRVMLPKKIDGLLAVGRSASGIPDTLLRNRLAVKHMGEAGGIAAAMAARRGVSPKELDMKDLQLALLDAGFYLGDRHRLKELGLV